MSADEDTDRRKRQLEYLNLLLEVLIQLAKLFGYLAGGSFFAWRVVSEAEIDLPNWLWSPNRGDDDHTGATGPAQAIAA